MKHIKLYQTNGEQMSDVLLNPSAPYPIVSYSKDNIKVGFCGNPVVNAEVMIPQTNEDDDMPLILKSDMNIKSLTVDGELLWKKDTFIKHTYEISANDFVEDRKGYVFYKASMLNKINNCSKNIHITCDSEPFGIFMFAYETDYYGDTRANGIFLPLSELSTVLSIEKIGENKYDFTQTYLKLNYLEGVSVYFVLTDSNENILQQTIEFECLEVYAGDEQTMDITKDNILTYANHGHVGKIVGDISADDYFLLIMWNEGQFVQILPAQISELISFGMGGLSDNELQFDITLFIGTSGFPQGISFSYGIANSLLDVDTLMDSGNEYLLNYVKDVTVKFKPTFNYLPILSQGNHVLKFELAQHKQFAQLTPNYLINVDMSKVDGHYINIVGTFAGATNLKGVKLPKHIEYIGRSAFFNCTSLTSVTIPNSVTSIDNSAFLGSRSLTSIVIPNSVTSIYDNAFSGCTSLTTVTIPSSVTSISYGAFRDCKSLTSVTILDGVTSIGGCVFYGCTNLTSIEIPNSVTSIDSSAFDGTPFYNNLPNGEIYLGGCYYKYKGTMPSNTSITIKDGTKTICDNAFYGCTSLTSIVIPDSVTSIGQYAFNGCSSLSSITIPSSVTSIGYSAFRNCTSLSSVEIPSSVISIDGGAFYGCYFEHDKFINNSSASGYPWSAALCDIVQDDGLCISGTTAIKCRPNATNVVIPDSVTSIGGNAFSGCTNLTTVTIPSSVTSITSNAFVGYIFQRDKLVNNSSVSGYPWGATLYDIVQDDGLCISGTTAVKCKTNATNVTIPGNVKNVGNKAFSGCTNLASVTILDGVTSIGSSAFTNCTSLSSVTISDSVTKIGYCAFSGCKNLVSVNIPNNMSNIQAQVFEDCASLTSIVIPSKVTVIEPFAFYNCTSLSSITCLRTLSTSVGAAFENLPTNGKLYAPSGSDYSSWLSSLPSGWTIEYV